jgi:hypothetical protein
VTVATLLRSRRRRPDEEPGDLATPEEAPRTTEEEVLDLQRSAGNRAVSRLLQRDAAGAAFSPFAPGVGPGLFPRPGTLGSAADIGKPVPEATQQKIRAFLESERYNIQSRVGDGTISMPEVVQMVRQACPEAAALDGPAVQAEVNAFFRPLAIVPPPTRRKPSAAGRGEELAARLSNALPSAPKIRISSRAGSLELTASGLVATTTVGGAKVTATGTPGGGEVKAKKGDVSVTAEVSATKVGLSAKVDRATFGAKLEKDEKSGQWSKWELGVRVAVAGNEPLEEMPQIPELQEAVVKAEAAIREIAAHLSAGGDPRDAKVKDLLKEVKPALEGVKRAVEKPKGPNVTVGVTAKGGDEKLGVFVGVSLIIEF